MCTTIPLLNPNEEERGTEGHCSKSGTVPQNQGHLGGMAVTLSSINLGFYNHPLGVVIVPFMGHLHADGLMLTSPHLDSAVVSLYTFLYQYHT